MLCTEISSFRNFFFSLKKNSWQTRVERIHLSKSYHTGKKKRESLHIKMKELSSHNTET